MTQYEIGLLRAKAMELAISFIKEMNLQGELDYIGIGETMFEFIIKK